MHKQRSAEGGSTVSIAPELDGPARLAIFRELPEPLRASMARALRLEVEEREHEERERVVTS